MATNNRSRLCGLLFIGAVGFSVTFGGCSPGASREESHTHTLYRNSNVTGGSTMRIHVATFDSADGLDYNAESCAEVARAMQQRRASFLNEPSDIRWWCERGEYRGN
jgi:hypothetical protein